MKKISFLNMQFLKNVKSLKNVLDLIPQKNKKRVTHKQSKYLTIMLIPDSSGKVKSLKIPHWVLHMTYCLAAVALTIVIISSQQASYFAEKLDESSVQLSETIKEKQEIEGEKVQLETTFNEEKDNLATAFQNEKDKLIDEKETIENKINDFESKVENLQEKIKEIDKIKQEIYDKMSDLKEIGAPISVALIENQDDDKLDPMGGPYVPADLNDSFDSVLNSLEAKLQRNIEELSLLNEAATEIVPFLRAYPTTWPVSGRVTSGFGTRSNPFGGSSVEGHTGLDIKCSTGTKIAVTGDGVVSFSGWKNGYGNIVIVSHGYGFSTYYAHNSKLLSSVGDKVSRGDIIALSGSTGRSTGPHCHYEVRVNNIPQNPWNYLD